MDIRNEIDLDNNNNVIRILNNNDQNQANFNIPNVNGIEQNINSNMENNVHMNRSNLNMPNVETITGADELPNRNHDSVDTNVDQYNGELRNDINSSIENNLSQNEHLSVIKDNQNMATNHKRSQKKRKRHYNLNKNKKWSSKSFKRQKSINTIKLDVENVSQNNRNKHIYTKVMHRGSGLSKFFLPDKRPRKDIIVPPTKFVLGGNISDPLNLNSLQDEALVSMSAMTPNSPITTPPKVEVIIPPNIYDPLHLLDPVDSIEYEKQLVSPDKSRRLKQRSKKKRIRKNNPEMLSKKNEAQDITHTEAHAEAHTSSDLSRQILDMFENQDYDVPGNSTNTEEKDLDLNVTGMSNRKRKTSESGASSMNNSGSVTGNINKKVRRFDSKNKIVSPVIPQPGAWKRPPKVLLGAPRNRIRTASTSDADNSEELNVKKSDATACEDSKTTNIVVKFQNKDCSPEHFVSSTCNTATLQEPTKYQFGNYAGHYCGLKSLFNFSDVRLTVFMRHAYLFKDKDVLDIGCNVGHMTIAVARSLCPKSVVGIDVDKDLIARARRNLSFFQRIPEYGTRVSSSVHKSSAKLLTSNSEKDNLSNKPKIPSRSKDREKFEQNQNDFFPLTFPICFGSMPYVKHLIDSPSSSPASNTPKADNSVNNKSDLHEESSSHDAPPTNDDSPKYPNRSPSTDDRNDMIHTFPYNVLFRTLNYAVTEESQMLQDKQQYDLILCLSLTKWIHLNFGDSGLKMTFRRMFNQLRPGGKLILEAQNWASYKKRKKLTPNYNNIEFFPENFHEYLLSPEVGFSHSYTLGIPQHAKKGFYRPIQLYIKGDFTPSQVRWSDTYHPQTPYEPMVRYAHYVDPARVSMPHRWNYNKLTNLYRRDTFSHGRNRYNTPSGISRYYNPLETDNYLPSGRKSASQTPLFGSIRRVDDEQDISTKHLYFTPRALLHQSLEGGTSSHSLDDSNNVSPHTPHVYAIGSGSGSVRETDSDTNTNSPKHHVYAFQ